MAPPLKVVVCDDDEDRAADWAERIQETVGSDIVDAEHLPTHEFAAAAAALKERKAYAKQHGDIPHTGDAADVFDRADVVVLDSDLTPDAGSPQGENPTALVQQHLVGELGGEVAHLARCYSTAGALMVVNQKWKRRSFDLTLLTFARDVGDVYVSETDLDNPRLWLSPDGNPEEFRPWSWPRLTELPSAIRSLTESASLSDAVLSTLGLDSDLVRAAFTDRQLDGLGLEEWESMTFDDVARDSAFGLRLKEIVGEQQRLRIATCGVRRWLASLVLPSHNVLVDLPHVLQQRPWVVPERADVAAWNAPECWFAASESTGPALDPSPDAYAATASRWLGRHVWIAPLLAQNAIAPRQRLLSTDPVFCEDVSAFVDSSQAVDFVSDLEGATGQRFVRSLPEVDYHPRRRLLT